LQLLRYFNLNVFAAVNDTGEKFLPVRLIPVKKCQRKNCFLPVSPTPMKIFERYQQHYLQHGTLSTAGKPATEGTPATE